MAAKLVAPSNLGPGGFVVAAADVREVLEREWKRLVRAAEDKHSSEEFTGAVKLLAARAVRFVDDAQANELSMIRRICEVRSGRSKAMRASIAEALLMAVDTSLVAEGIPTFPGAKTTANEMVETHYWIEEVEADPIVAKRLARSLTNFAKGYIYAEAEIEVAEAAA